jgi:hypothetical protein
MQAKSDDIADSIEAPHPKAVGFSEIQSVTMENYLKNVL